MAEGGVLPICDDRFKCSICWENFKKPKLLPCFHTFCVECLDTYSNKNSSNNRFPCPLCRKETDIPLGGVDKFQSNFYIGIASEESPQEVYCDVCGPKSVARHRCVDCEENFCENCSNAHLKMKMSKNHKLIEVTAVDSSKKRTFVTRELCQDHSNEELKFVCKKCDKLLCTVCKLTDHENHPSKDITTEATEFRQKISSSLSGVDLTGSLERLEKDIKETSVYIDQLRLTSAEEVKKVRSQTSALCEIIATIESKTVEKVADFYEVTTKEAEAELDDLRRDYQSFISTKKSMTLIADHENNIGILRKRTELMATIESIGSRIVSDTRRKFEGNLFTPGKLEECELQAMIGNVGPADAENLQEKLPINLPLTSSRVINKENLRLISKISFPWKRCVISIAAVDDGTVWISCFDCGAIYQVNLAGKIQKSINVGYKCDCVARDDDSGDLFVSCIGQSSAGKLIKRISKVDSRTPRDEIIITCSDYPHGLACVTLSGKSELLYTCTDSVTFVNGREGSLKGITFVRDKILYIREFKATIGGLPIRISTDAKTGRFCVADYDNSVIATYDKDGLLLYQYNHHAPRSVFFYNEHSVLVCDGESIRINSIDGSDSEVLLQGNDFWSVSVDKLGYLWVGMMDGKMTVYQIENATHN